MKLLIFDTETTGVDPQKDRVVEAAGALFSVRYATTIGAFSFVVRQESNGAQAINRLPVALLQDHGIAESEAFTRIGAWMQRADAVVAHNAAFDRGFMPGAVAELRPWVCSQEDIEWPAAHQAAGVEPQRERPGQSLVALCLAHGVGVSHAHRALTDVMLLARLLERVAERGHDLTNVMARAMRPRALFAAVTGRYDPAVNERLKAAGFRWHPDPVKEWRRRVPWDEVPDVKAATGCELRQVQP